MGARDDRGPLLRWLAAARYGRLLAAARAAGAAADAEDAVQDVLTRLAAGVGDLPSDRDAATAYALTAVRRRAIDLVRAGRTAEAVGEIPYEPREVERAEAARAVRAFAAATAPLDDRARAVLVLDAAGWSRDAVAHRLGVSERVVKRALDAHRAAVLEAAARALDGSDCDLLAATLAAYAGRGLRPRRGGPAAAHLELCDGCRAAHLAALRTRAALRALFPPPVAFGVAGLGGSSPLPALLGKGWLAALVGAAAIAGGGSSAVHDSHVARPAPLVALPLPHLVLAVAEPQLGTTARTVAATAALVRAATRAGHRVHVPRDPFAARVPPGGCDLGTLGVCGLGSG